MTGPDRRRCAIYTRKSSEEGLEQDFNSLHAQREACEAFVMSQHHEGWRLIETAYDDGGISGGTMDRPGLQRLLEDIRADRVDTIVVYKVDRLTRSLADFAKMVELFDARGVSFVAVTQQFNTTTSMGRLTLNVLLSFAQFEREVTGERIRDKIAASKKKGIWMGGVTPLGYEVQDRKLVPVPSEAEAVRAIYNRYLELGSVRLLQRDLERQGIRSKVRLRRDGSRTGGAAFSRGALYALLSNPIYIGEIGHKGTRYQGQHEAILDRDLWAKAQLRLREQGPGSFVRDRKTAPSPLTGRLFDEVGNPLTPTHASKNGRRYRYYVSTALTRGAKDQAGWRLPACQLEAAVASGAVNCLTDRKAMSAALEQAGIPPAAIARALAAASDQAQRLQSDLERAQALSDLVERIQLLPKSMRLTLRLATLLSGQGDEEMGTGSPLITRDVALHIKRRGVELRLVIEDPAAAAPRVDTNLLKEVGRAYRCFDALLTRKVASFSELSIRERIDERYVRRILPLAFLAPDIVHAIVAGTHPVELTAKQLIRRTALPLEWHLQMQALAFR